MRCLLLLGMMIAGLAAADFAGTQDADGWTVITPAADSRVIYVSDATGDNANDGLSSGAPLKTIAAGVAKLRDGYPDQLLLKRGDVWTGQRIGDFRKSGRSASEPLLIGAYGDLADPRPHVRTGAADFLTIWNVSGAQRSHIVVQSIHMEAHTWDGSQSSRCGGVRCDAGGENILIEDCLIEGYAGNLGFNAPSASNTRANVIVRRCVIADCFARTDRSYSDGNSHSQGLYAANVDGLLVEDCVFDHCGWHDTITGGEKTIYNHDLYIQYTNRDVILRRNIHANGASDVVQCRPGGEVIDNLILRCPIGAWYGIAHRGEQMPSRLMWNVVVEGNDISASLPRGSGLMAKRSRDGEVAYNLVSTEISDWSHYAIRIDLANDATYPVTMDQPTRVHDNVIWKWGTGGAGTGDGFVVSNVGTGELVRSNNQEDGVVLETGDPVTYPDPDRSIASYQASLGATATVAAFVAEARQQRRGYWRRAYTAVAVGDYFRAGFGMTLREQWQRIIRIWLTDGSGAVETMVDLRDDSAALLETSAPAANHSFDGLEASDDHRLEPDLPAASL